MFCALNQNENISSSATQTHTHTRTQIHIQTNQTEKEKKKYDEEKLVKICARSKIRIFQTKTTNEMTLQRTALDLLVETIHSQIWWPFSAANSFT